VRLKKAVFLLFSDCSLTVVLCIHNRVSKLLEEIGEGAFGVVYMAALVEPVQRKVALKIIKAGMDTREVVARFEAERQALALMDHPSIAQVFDGGVTQAGRPYFVMELVQGIAITEFCDQRNLTTTERLKLFIQVCHAVQHAHQKGIIHRDLKPSNILVTLVDGRPVPKVIDFGVAKALGRKLTDKTLFTGFLKMVGTPAYMSPEQADLSGVDIDTRSDIYALGVVLYELLTGVTPFDAETLRDAALDEIRRLIRETDPPKPSTRLQTLVAADVRRLKSSTGPTEQEIRASSRLRRDRSPSGLRTASLLPHSYQRPSGAHCRPRRGDD
jgi:serine/threonine protein kinase